MNALLGRLGTKSVHLMPSLVSRHSLTPLRLTRQEDAAKSYFRICPHCLSNHLDTCSLLGDWVLRINKTKKPTVQPNSVATPGTNCVKGKITNDTSPTIHPFCVTKGECSNRGPWRGRSHILHFLKWVHNCANLRYFKDRHDQGKLAKLSKRHGAL
jgi:hypothetical protein